MKLKKMLALLLALVIVFALAACGEGSGNKDDDKGSSDSVKSPIVGQWECKLYQDGADMGMDEFKGVMTYEMDYEFKADGTYTVKPNKDVILKSAAQFEEALVQYMVDLMYAQLTEDGSTKEEADQWMIDNNGKNVVDYCKEQVDTYDMSGQMAAVIEDMDMAGTYTVSDNKLVLNNNAGTKENYTFKLVSNDCIQLSSKDSQFGDLMKQLGEEYLVLNRVG